MINHTIKINLLILGVLLGLVGPVAAQNNSTNFNFKFKNISVGDGLSNTSVSSIVQDKRGFMWIGTRDGLNRYDGLEIKIFREDLADSTSISNNWIPSLLVDRDGDLWIATKNGLNRYNETTGFQKYFFELGNPTKLSDNDIFSLLEDKDGNIWIGTSRGLNRFDKNTGLFEQYFHHPNEAHSLSSNHVKAIFEDNNGHLWLMTSKGIDRFDVKKNLFKHFPFDVATLQKITPNQIVDIFQDKKGRIWVGHPNGLWYYDENLDDFRKYQSSKKDGTQQIESSVRAIHEDKNGYLWVGTYTGIYLLTPERDKFTIIQHDKLNPYSIKENSIYAIYEDGIGNIWLGSWWGGLDYLDRNFDNFMHFNEVTGLSFHIVSSFAEEPTGNFWIGTEGGGVNYFNRSKRTFEVFMQDPSNPKSLATDNVQDVALHRGNKLIVGTHGKGVDVFWFQKRIPEFQHFVHQENEENSISSDWITSMTIDSKNRIWIGTIDGGLNQFLLKKGQFIRYKEIGNQYSQVNTIFEDRQKNIWVSTGKGLGFVDADNHEINYEIAQKINEQTNKSIFCIYQDPQNNFWLGTEGDGLIYFEDGFTNIKKYHQKDGLPNNLVYGILPDANNHLWVSTNYGLSKFDLATQIFENYDVSDGLQSNEFNIDAYAKSSKGELMFGGVNGFNIFNPEKVRKNTYHPPVIIKDFSVNEEIYPIHTSSDGEIPEVVLSYEQTPFSFDFVALNYTQPGKNKLAYQLEGQSDDWIEIDNNRSQSFSGIVAGDYTFKLKAANNNGVWNDDFAAIKIKISPPWWQTTWAYLFYFLSFLFLAGFIRHHVLIRIRDKRALMQEKIERERIENLNQLKLQFFTNVSHELRTPLTLIYGPLERLKNQIHTLNKEQQDALDLIDQNTQKMLRHVNSILDFRKDESGLLKLKAAKGNFVKFVKETTLAFQELAKNRKIDFRFKADSEAIPLYYDRDKMEVILYNLISNAFKFTPDDGQIRVRLHPDVDDKLVQLSIEDNGCGIEEKYKEFIFEPYFQIETGTAINDATRKGSGIGLALTKKMVELHHGKIAVDTSKRKGTRFTIFLPKGKAHFQAEEIIADFKNSEEIAGYLKRKADDLAQPHEAASNTPIKLNQPSILIVEDNKDVRSFIKDCLEEDYLITVAADGAEGYQKAIKLLPNLIISDVMMPKMDGITLCSKLKTEFHTSHIPVMLLTARTSLIFEKSGLETGADDYITKPFTPSLLKLRIRNLLDARKKLQQHFVRNLKANPKEVTITSQDNQFLTDALECVEKHLSEDDFSAAIFAKKMNCSQSALYKKLKGITGQTISEFTRTIRIKRAAQILKQDKSSISQVAYTVGFNDLKYFRKCFRKQFGVSPSEFVKENWEGLGMGGSIEEVDV